jgi:hypothetical protein
MSFDGPFWPVTWRRIPEAEFGWAPAIEVLKKKAITAVSASRRVQENPSCKPGPLLGMTIEQRIRLCKEFLLHILLQ